MKRKLIKQGCGGLTMYLPKKWTDKMGLIGGNEVEIEVKDSNLMILAEKGKVEKKEISLDLPEKESSTRTLIVNAYRAGFDKITATYNGDISVLNGIVDKFLIGFEIFKDENKFIIESVSEPNEDNFSNLIQRQFIILGEVLENLQNLILKTYVYKIQKYDNFLKRCITKEIIESSAKHFLWQFLSSLTHITRLIYHFYNNLKSELNDFEKEIVGELKEMLIILRTSFTKKDYLILEKVHMKHDKVIKSIKSQKVISSNDLDLLLITKQMYLANSPLTGLIEIESFKSS